MKQFSTFVVFTICALMMTSSAFAQLSGKKTVPGDYPTLSAAIEDINIKGVGPGGVTIVVVDESEVIAPSEGFIISARASDANPITIIGNGKPILVPGFEGHVAVDAIFKNSSNAHLSIMGFDVEVKVLEVTPPATIE